jgi:hypothetical protein
LVESHIVFHTISIGATLNNHFTNSGAKLHIAFENSFAFNQLVILRIARQFIYLILKDSISCFISKAFFVNVPSIIAIHNFSLVAVICFNQSILFLK